MTISKTAAGHQVLKDRSARLTPRQRAALILVDGQRSVEELTPEASARDSEETRSTPSAIRVFRARR